MMRPQKIHTATNFKRRGGLNGRSESLGGTVRWFRNDLLHRTDGPAVEVPDGTQYWYRDGDLHRDDGPAVIWDDGSRCWYHLGLLHRTDGPAIESVIDRQEWWLHGVQYDPVVWLLKVRELLEEQGPTK